MDNIFSIGFWLWFVGLVVWFTGVVSLFPAELSNTLVIVGMGAEVVGIVMMLIYTCLGK